MSPGRSWCCLLTARRTWVQLPGWSDSCFWMKLWVVSMSARVFFPKTCKIRSSGESKLPLGVIVGVNGVCMCMYVPACPPQQWVCSLSWVYSCLFALWAPASARQTRVTLMCVKWVKRMTERADNAANVCWSGANMSLLHCAGSGRSGY